MAKSPKKGRKRTKRNPPRPKDRGAKPLGKATKKSPRLIFEAPPAPYPLNIRPSDQVQ